MRIEYFTTNLFETMAPSKKYTKLIDIDIEWNNRAEELGMYGSPDEQIVSGPNSDLFGISYRQLALLQSRLGYTDPFFTKSPATFNESQATFEGFRDHVVYIKCTYDWICQLIDGNFSSDQIKDKLNKIERKANELSFLVEDFSQHFRQIKIRRLKAHILFPQQLKQAVPDEEEMIFSDEPDWRKYGEIISALSSLEDLSISTKLLFKSPGGAPYKFSKTWLILEAIQVYEEWNIDRLKAGISREVKTGNPSGPFVRFLDQVFKTIDVNYNDGGGEGLRNAGLATEAAKILSYKKKNPNSIHRELSPDLPADRLVYVLRSLVNYRT